MGFLRCTQGSARGSKSPRWGVVATTPLRWAHLGPMKPPGDAPPLSGW